MLGPELALTGTTSQESRVTGQEVVQSTQNLSGVQQKARLVTGFFPPLVGRMDILRNQGLRGIEGTTHRSQVNKGLGKKVWVVLEGESLPLFLEEAVSSIHTQPFPLSKSIQHTILRCQHTRGGLTWQGHCWKLQL